MYEPSCSLLLSPSSSLSLSHLTFLSFPLSPISLIAQVRSFPCIILTLGFLDQEIPQVILAEEDHGDDLEFDIYTSIRKNAL